MLSDHLQALHHVKRLIRVSAHLALVFCIISPALGQDEDEPTTPTQEEAEPTTETQTTTPTIELKPILKPKPKKIELKPISRKTAEDAATSPSTVEETAATTRSRLTPILKQQGTASPTPSPTREPALDESAEPTPVITPEPDFDPEVVPDLEAPGYVPPVFDDDTRLQQPPEAIEPAIEPQPQIETPSIEPAPEPEPTPANVAPVPRPADTPPNELTLLLDMEPTLQTRARLREYLRNHMDSPHVAPLLNRIGEISLLLNDPYEARQAYQVALKMAKDSAHTEQAQWGLARAAALGGDSEAAVNQLDATLPEAPSSAALAEKAWILAAAGHGEAIDSILDDLPPDADANDRASILMARALSLELGGSVRQAQALYQRIVAEFSRTRFAEKAQGRLDQLQQPLVPPALIP